MNQNKQGCLMSFLRKLSSISYPKITKVRYSSTFTGTKVLIIIDGYGEGQKNQYNALYVAHTPNLDKIRLNNPMTLLHASGEHVGLISGQPGNSEAGHINIAAGAVVKQDYVVINEAIKNASFFNNEILNSAISKLEFNDNKLHVFGLLSTKGTHSHEDHLFAFLELCKKRMFNKVLLHIILEDGDSSQQSLEKLQQYLKTNLIKGKPIAEIASIIGRHYAMNRNGSWHETQKFYNLLTQSSMQCSQESIEQSLQSWKQQSSRESKYPPTRFMPNSNLRDGDILFTFNYRSDRVLQILESLMKLKFEHFKRQEVPRLRDLISIVKYPFAEPINYAFTSESPKTTLGEVVAKHNLSQLRIAESEKGPHVTSLFNGSNEIFTGEKRIIIPSPQIPSYDLQPKMSAEKVTDELICAVEKQIYNLIVCNFANGDAVGHTGNFPAIIQALEYLDYCFGRIIKALRDTNSEALFTADHGIFEETYDPIKRKIIRDHTTSKVPCIYFGQSEKKFRNRSGSLTDIAPTMLDLLGLPKPDKMTGDTLFNSKNRVFFVNNNDCAIDKEKKIKRLSSSYGT